MSKIFDPISPPRKGERAWPGHVQFGHQQTRRYINAKSEVGAGTIFFFYLPALVKFSAAKEAEEECHPAARGRILVMEDEELVRDLAYELLRVLGYEPGSRRTGLRP